MDPLSHTRRARPVPLGLLALIALTPMMASARPAPRGEANPLRVHRRDPAPLWTRDYLDVDVALAGGEVRVLGVKRGRFKKAKSLPRFEGRYQIRLYAHKLLRDLVRFSFPLTLAAGEPTRPNLELNRALARGVTARTTVRVPMPSDLSRALVFDPKRGLKTPIDLKKILGPDLKPNLPAPKRTSVFSGNR